MSRKIGSTVGCVGTSVSILKYAAKGNALMRRLTKGTVVGAIRSAKRANFVFMGCVIMLDFTR